MNKMCLTPTCSQLGLAILLFSFLLGGCAGLGLDTQYDEKTRIYSLGKGDSVTSDYSTGKGANTKSYNANSKENLTAEYIYHKGGRPAPETRSIHSKEGALADSGQSGDAGPKAEKTVLVLQVDDILFDFDKSVIKTEFVPELDEWADYLNNDPEIIADVYGHADSTGPMSYNQKLSEKRAQAVVNYLVDKGVERSRLTAKGFGETQPIAPNATEEGRQKNRRVELSY